MADRRRPRSGTAARATVAPARSARRSTSDACGISTLRGHPAAAGRGEVHRPAVPAGQPADHEEAEHLGRHQVEPLAAGRAGRSPRPAAARSCRCRGRPRRSGRRSRSARRRPATRVCGGENTVAFSISSASTSTRSPTTAGAAETPGRHLHVDPGVVLDLAERQPDHVGQRQRRDVLVGARPSRRARPGCRRCGAAGWRCGRAGTGAPGGPGRSPAAPAGRSARSAGRPGSGYAGRRGRTSAPRCAGWPPAARPAGRRCSAPGRRRGPGRRSRRWPGRPTGSRRIGWALSASSSATRTSSASATRATRSAERVSRVSGRATVRATARLSSTTSARISAAAAPTRYAAVSARRCSARHLGDDVGDELLLDELTEA